MKRSILLIIALMLITESAKSQSLQEDIPWVTLAKSDWAMIKHDPQFTGRSPFKGPQTPTIVWKRSLPDGIFSGPVIGAEGNLYFGSYYQLDSADYFYSYSYSGKMRWKYKLGGNRPPQSGILIDSSNTIYFGSLDQYFYALNSDGTLKWKVETGYITEILIPNIDLQGNLYITNNPNGELLSINQEGKINWRVKYGDGFLEKSPAISPDGNTIYIAGKDSNLYAMDLNGNLVWEYSCGLIRRFPILDNSGNLYFLPEGIPQKLYSLKPDGAIRWEVNIIDSFFIPVNSTPTIDKQGNIYIAFGSGIMSYDYNGLLRWTYIIGSNPDDYDEFWQPLICDSEGTIYVGSTIGKYYYAISSEGELKWKLPLNDYQVDNTGAIAKDGTLYIGVHKSSLWNESIRNLIAIIDTNTTGVANEIKITSYKLTQNYPNPFNPATTIEYQIPIAGYVNLTVYNILGEKIKTLVNQFSTAGKHNVTFNAADLPSGTYIYKITAGKISEVRKMQLIK